MRISNFGKNVLIQSADYFEPQSEDELLEILRSNRDRRFRTIGRLHSWSEAPKSEDVLINLKHLNEVQIADTQDYVEVGAGCQIKRLISCLDAAGLALPSQGLITEQTVAGAISTGTHGSGKQSLSHFVNEVRVAIFDAHTGEPIIRTIVEEPELSAARCSIGCTGVILSVKLPCQPQYLLEEHFRFHPNLDSVLHAEGEFPLQQFYVLPHTWQFMAQHRKVVDGARSKLLASLYQAYWFASVDLGLHVILLLLARVLNLKAPIRFFYKHIVPWTIIRNLLVVDKSQRLLTMEHELFRHIEIEVFVQRSKLDGFLEFVRCLVDYSAGDASAFNKEHLSNPDLSEVADNCKSLWELTHITTRSAFEKCSPKSVSYRWRAERMSPITPLALSATTV